MDGRDDEGRSGEGRSGEGRSGERAGHPSGPGADPLHQELASLRERISRVDDELIRLIGERKDLAVAIGRVKARLELPVMDPAREAQVVRAAAERARSMGVDEEMTRDVIWRIIAAARAQQERRPVGWPETPSTAEPPRASGDGDPGDGAG